MNGIGRYTDAKRTADASLAVPLTLPYTFCNVYLPSFPTPRPPPLLSLHMQHNDQIKQSKFKALLQHIYIYIYITNACAVWKGVKSLKYTCRSRSSYKQLSRRQAVSLVGDGTPTTSKKKGSN